MYDIDIRMALKEYLTQEFAHSNSIIVDEFKVCWGDARVDIAVVNSCFHGYEIKSDKDTLERLPHQVELYGKVFDKMSIVCSKKWLKKARTIIPHWWGIITAEETNGIVTLKRKRQERINHKTDLRSVLELTWKDEALEILASQNIINGFKSKARWAIWDKIMEIMRPDNIESAVRNCIKSRTNWRSAETLLRV